MKYFSIVVAMDECRGIGKKGSLAWDLPADLKRFKELTATVTDSKKVNAVVMGRKTWDSLPEKFRPLPGRLNVVLSNNKNIQLPQGVLVFGSFDEALGGLSHRADVENIFVIGGAKVYAFAIDHANCQTIYTTVIQDDFSCDAFFPAINPRFKQVAQASFVADNGLQYSFAKYSIS